MVIRKSYDVCKLLEERMDAIMKLDKSSQISVIGSFMELYSMTRDLETIRFKLRGARNREIIDGLMLDGNILISCAELEAQYIDSMTLEEGPE